MISLKPKRYSAGGKFSFPRLPDGEIEVAAHKYFANMIEEQFKETPPCMHIERWTNNDIKIAFELGEDFSDKDGALGPSWIFSLKDACDSMENDYSKEDVASFANSLRRFADFIDRKNKK
jgi:hypothetical protein